MRQSVGAGQESCVLAGLSSASWRQSLLDLLVSPRPSNSRHRPLPGPPGARRWLARLRASAEQLQVHGPGRLVTVRAVDGQRLLQQLGALGHLARTPGARGRGCCRTYASSRVEPISRATGSACLQAGDRPPRTAPAPGRPRPGCTGRRPRRTGRPTAAAAPARRPAPSPPALPAAQLVVRRRCCSLSGPGRCRSPICAAERHRLLQVAERVLGAAAGSAPCRCCSAPRPRRAGRPAARALDRATRCVVIHSVR